MPQSGHDLASFVQHRGTGIVRWRDELWGQGFEFARIMASVETRREQVCASIQQASMHVAGYNFTVRNCRDLLWLGLRGARRRRTARLGLALCLFDRRGQDACHTHR
jgi:hypothetical protein